MGIFSRKQTTETRALRSELLKMVVGYTPSFSTYSGGLYEMDLTVSAIDAFARHASKANIKIKGKAYKNLSNQWKVRMNDTMTTQQFLYRLATIFKCENNAFLIPVYGDHGEIVGIHPISSIGATVTEVNGTLMLKFRMNQKEYAMPYSEVGHVKSHQYKNELFGDGNQSLNPTMQLLDIQKQGIVNGIKTSGVISFLGRIAQTARPEEITRVRKEFNEQNLTIENQGGIGLYDSKIADVQQVKREQFIVDTSQAEHIEKSVFNYIGVNTKIMQNDYNEDTWGSFYEGGQEPFLIQVGQVLTCMMFTPKEIAMENEVIIESTRLQHANTATKWKVCTEGMDRGVFSVNESREIMNLPPIEDGDRRYIRMEYTAVENLDKVQKINKVDEPKETQENEEDDKTV